MSLLADFFARYLRLASGDEVMVSRLAAHLDEMERRAAGDPKRQQEIRKLRTRCGLNRPSGGAA